MATRVTQEFVEAWYATNNADARVTQEFIEVWYAQNLAVSRVTDVKVEVLAREYQVDATRNQHAVFTDPASYPVPSTGGPTYTNLLRLAPRYQIDAQKFKTGGRDFRLKAQTKIYEFVITYDFLTVAEAATLDAHFISARGEWAGFDFVDPRSGSTFRNTHYAPDGLVSKPAQKRWAPAREVRLIWSSATGSIAAADSGDGWDTDTWDTNLFGQ